MKKRSLNKTQLATWVTLLVILFLGACYFFIYMPANEQRVQEQRFRSLQNVQRNLQTRIDNSVALMDVLLTAYNDSAANHSGLDDYISTYANDKFRLTIPKRMVIARDSADSVRKYKVDVNRTSGIVSITASKVFNEAAENPVVYHMSLQFSIKQFIAPLLPQDVFDEYLVFLNDRLIYETLPAGVSRVFNDSLLHVKNGIWGTTVRDFSISGANYKLFLQPVVIGEKECVIGGLLADTRYRQERARLPAGVVMFLITVVLLIVLSTPWIKLSQMGSKDRLTISDAILTVLISMLLVSLLFFMFFKYNVPLRADINRNEKMALADTITKAFSTEIDSAYSKVRSLDAIVDSAAGDIVNLKTASIAYATGRRVLIDSQVNKTIGSFPLKQVYWLDEEGNEKINWNVSRYNGPHSNYKGRPYFDNIVNERYYLQANKAGNPFYIDQVVSKTTGNFTTVISIPSAYKGHAGKPGTYVTGMSFNVASLGNILLPAGFQYCIIDAGGKVLYHSDSTRNLNENLLEEFSESDKLKSLLVARSSGVFITPYYSSNYAVFAKPLSNLPYFILVMEDLGYKETRDTEVFSFTLFGMMCFLGFMMVQMLVTFVVSSKRSFLKKHFYNTAWIGPKRSSHRQYNLSAIANFYLIILLVIYLRYATFLSFCFILLFSVTFLSFFLSALFARRYKREKPSNFGYKKNALIWLGTCILLLNIAALMMLSAEGMLCFFSFELFAMVGCLPLFIRGDRVLDEARVKINPAAAGYWNFASSFTLVALTRLIISSGIPVMFFYITAFNYEQNLIIRYRQLDFGKTLVSSVSPDKLKDVVASVNKLNAVYVDGTWLNKIGLVDTSYAKDVAKDYNDEDILTLRLLNIARIKISGKAVDDDKLYWPKSVDTTVYHNNILHVNDRNTGAITCIKTGTPGVYLMLSSDNINYGFTRFFNFVVFLVLLVVAMVIFYYTLRNIIVKLFALSIPDFSRWQVFDDEIVVTQGLNNLLFVIGLPGSGKLTRITDKIAQGEIRFSEKEAYILHKNNDAESNVFVVELMNIPDSDDKKEAQDEWLAYEAKIFDPKNRLLIFNHFEYNIQDAQTSRIKLNLLEKVMMQNQSRVIILSTIHPVAFLDSIYAHESNADDKLVPGQDLERWHVLLGHFRIVVFPLKSEVMNTPHNKVEQLVFEETSKTHYLNKMQQLAVSVGTRMAQHDLYHIVSDELAIKLQMTSHYFYMYVWQSLTKEEKFLLYDLAEDNLVNAVDDYNLNMLICKGVIVRADGSLKIFNNGFRNFILTAIGNIELMKIRNQIYDNGNWNKVKYPLYMVFVAIVLFLFTSQQEAYTKLLTYAAAVGTAIPAILKIFSLFDGIKQKES